MYFDVGRPVACLWIKTATHWRTTVSVRADADGPSRWPGSRHRI